jgi:hypothetical protein
MGYPRFNPRTSNARRERLPPTPPYPTRLGGTAAMHDAKDGDLVAPHLRVGTPQLDAIDVWWRSDRARFRRAASASAAADREHDCDQSRVNEAPHRCHSL